jgi:hypothetical protein
LLSSSMSSIVLGSDGTRHTPGGVIYLEAKAKRALAFHFLFVGRNVALGYTIRLLEVIGLSARFQVDMKFKVWCSIQYVPREARSGLGRLWEDHRVEMAKGALESQLSCWCR